MNKYKGILLDIDNTLYNYDTTHKIAKNKVLEFCINELKLEKDLIENAYEIRDCFDLMIDQLINKGFEVNTYRHNYQIRISGYSNG